MTKIIILALMVTTNPLKESDSYVFTEPYFTSTAECHLYVNLNMRPIMRHLYDQFGGKKVANIYCIPEKQLNKFFDNTRA